jgi:TAT (twin-arginine translocation) pathway signal sequence
MKDVEFSRRNMIALAGAGAAATALAGCTAPNTSTATETGEGDDFGDDPHGSITEQRVQFNPKFMGLVHLTSNGTWAISSNDAHFGFVQETYDKNARIKWACEIYSNKIAKGLKRFSDEPRGSRFQVIDKTPDAPTPDFADYLDFSKFGFGAPHDVYVFFEHAPGEITVDGENKRLLGFGGKLLSGKKADTNHAFFDAEVIAEAALLGGLAGKGTLIRFNNYCTVKDDKGYHELPYGDVENQTYKLDIFYKTQSGIAMAIDPDTGNGIGNGPPP